MVSVFQVEPPFTEHLFWVAVWRCKDAFDTDPLINYPSKTRKFRPVYFLAGIFPDTPLQP